jgi:hypothetical protein
MLRSTSPLRVRIGECGIDSVDSPVDQNEQDMVGMMGLTLWEINGSRQVIGHAREVSGHGDVVEE